MITTFLVEHAWITTAALIAVVTIGPVAGFWLVNRRRLAMRLGLASLLPIAALTFIPVNRDLAVGCASEWNPPTLGAVELMANLVLFVPPVLLLGVSGRRPFVVLLGASVGSGLIEVTQAFVTSFGRSCSTNDWLANTLGALLGAAIVVMVLWFRSDGEGARLSDA